MPYKDKNKRNAIVKKHYEKNKQKYQETQWKRRKERAKWFFEYKSKLKCELCEENHPSCLQFHHLDASAKKMEVTKMVASGCGEKRILEEIAKCQVLCSNCHLKKHWQENIESGLLRISEKYKNFKK